MFSGIFLLFSLGGEWGVLGVFCLFVMLGFILFFVFFISDVFLNVIIFG